jgi:5-(carboxyamino)imidazole ribonucleotide synthase
MNKQFYNDLKVGILGGGQLGRMFIQEAVGFNINTSVLDPDADAPCKNICNTFVNGSLQDFDTVYAFGKQVDVLTVEFENVNVDALDKLQGEGVLVYPQPDVLRIVQDKGLQKQFYKDKGIPTADFLLIDNKEEINKHADFLPCFQKLRKAGYDGKGVTKISSTADLHKAFEEPSVLEKFVDFEKELSVIVSRNAKGEIAIFPVVEQEFNSEANLVQYLFSPADINANIEKEAIAIAHKVAESIGIIGILAVELFLTKDGKVLVNEIAPRPHNSGHQTIEGNITSQYEQHLRAILNLPAGATDIKMPSVMVNLLGEKGHEGLAKYDGLDKVLAVSGVSLHLYGKRYTKSFRKMGHVTVVDADINKAKEKARFVKETLKVVTS